MPPAVPMGTVYRPLDHVLDPQEGGRSFGNVSPESPHPGPIKPGTASMLSGPKVSWMLPQPCPSVDTGCGLSEWCPEPFVSKPVGADMPIRPRSGARPAPGTSFRALRGPSPIKHSPHSRALCSWCLARHLRCHLVHLGNINDAAICGSFSTLRRGFCLPLRGLRETPHVFDPVSHTNQSKGKVQRSVCVCVEIEKERDTDLWPGIGSCDCVAWDVQSLQGGSGTWTPSDKLMLRV